MELTHILVAEKLNGTESWYWIPELDKYQQFSEGCDEEEGKPYEPHYMTPEEYEAQMEDSLYRNIAFYDGKEKYLAKQGAN